MSDFDHPRTLHAAARQLGEDGVLGPDPTEDTILLAAADLCDYPGDLTHLSRTQVARIVLAWESADTEYHS